MAVVTRVEPRQAGPGPRATGSPVNVVALGKQLSARVKGEVRFDEASRHLYANDASLYRQVPIGVVIPKDADDVLAALAGEQKRAHRGERLDYPAVHAAVNDAVALQVLASDHELGADLVLGGVGDRHAHRLDPAFGDRVQLLGEVLDHEPES